MASRDLKVTLIGDDRTGSAFGSAGSSADGLGSKFASLGKAAALGLAGMVAAAGAFAFKGVDAFARVEDAIGAAGVQFGSATSDVVAFASKASTAFGLSKGAALDAANTFGTMGKSAGLSGAGLAKFSTDFTGLAGDMASFKGTSPEQAIEAIGAALRGETEPIRAYGVLLDDASMRQEALSMGLIKTTKDALTPQQKVLAAQSLIYKQTSDAQGDFQRTSDSTANTAKRLAAETENASARLGEQLAPAVTWAREAFLKLIKSLSGLVEYIGPGIAKLMTAFSAFWAALREGDVTSDGLVGAFETVGDALHRVGLAVMSIIDFFQRHDAAAKVLMVVVGTVAAAVTAAWVAQAAVSTANAARSVIAWFVTATASTTSATIQSRSTAQIVVGWVAAAASAVANAAVVVAGWVAMGVQALIRGAQMAAAWVLAMGPVGWVIAAVVGLVALIVANWDTVVSWTRTAWNAVTGAIGAAWEWIKGAVKAGIDWLVNLFLNFTGPGLIIKHWNDIVNFTRNAWNAVTSAVSNAWNSITSAISNGISSAVSWVSSLPGKILGALGNFGSLLWNAGKAMIQGLIDGAGSLLRNIGKFFLNLVPSWIRGPFESALGINSPSKVFMGYGQNIGQGLINGMSSMRPAIAAEMASMADTGSLSSLGTLGGGAATGLRTLQLPTGSQSGIAATSGPAVHIENYNEARQPVHEIAQEFAFLARTR